MESRNDADGHDDSGTTLARLRDMNAAASSEPRSASPTFRTPVEVFNLEVEALLEGGELPALDILFSQTPVGFNYHSMMKSVIPMTFGQKGKDHVSPETLRAATKELDGAVGVLIESRCISTLEPRKTQAEVRTALGNALHEKGVIFMMRADESDETIASQSHRFGKHL